MTDDLVKRLRCDEHWPLDWDDAIAWCRAAADRIEKLEAALRELSEDWPCCGVSTAMRTIARKALEDKPVSDSDARIVINKARQALIP